MSEVNIGSSQRCSTSYRKNSHMKIAATRKKDAPKFSFVRASISDVDPSKTHTATSMSFDSFVSGCKNGTDRKWGTDVVSGCKRGTDRKWGVSSSLRSRNRDGLSDDVQDGKMSMESDKSRSDVMSQAGSSVCVVVSEALPDDGSQRVVKQPITHAEEDTAALGERSRKHYSKSEVEAETGMPLMEDLFEGSPTEEDKDERRRKQEEADRRCQERLQRLRQLQKQEKDMPKTMECQNTDRPRSPVSSPSGVVLQTNTSSSTEHSKPVDVVGKTKIKSILKKYELAADSGAPSGEWVKKPKRKAKSVRVRRHDSLIKSDSDTETKSKEFVLELIHKQVSADRDGDDVTDGPVAESVTSRPSEKSRDFYQTVDDYYLTLPRAKSDTGLSVVPTDTDEDSNSPARVVQSQPMGRFMPEPDDNSRVLEPHGMLSEPENTSSVLEPHGMSSEHDDNSQTLEPQSMSPELDNNSCVSEPHGMSSELHDNCHAFEPQSMSPELDDNSCVLEPQSMSSKPENNSCVLEPHGVSSELEDNSCVTGKPSLPSDDNSQVLEPRGMLSQPEDKSSHIFELHSTPADRNANPDTDLLILPTGSGLSSGYSVSECSDRSCRIDPHVYQSYAAGILHSSRKSGKFTRLQQRYGNLERIADIEKKTVVTNSEGGKKQYNVLDLRYKSLGSLEPTSAAETLVLSKYQLDSLWELKELFAELDEAQEDGEFLYDLGNLDELQWNPWNDRGLRSRSLSMQELRKLYESGRNLNDRSVRRCRRGSRKVNLREVGFNELREKYRHLDNDAQSKKMTVTIQQLEKRERRGSDGSVNSQSLASSGSYIDMMEIAARNAKQRPMYGYHIVENPNRYEEHVRQMKKAPSCPDVHRSTAGGESGPSVLIKADQRKPTEGRPDAGELTTREKGVVDANASSSGEHTDGSCVGMTTVKRPGRLSSNGTSDEEQLASAKSNECVGATGTSDSSKSGVQITGCHDNGEDYPVVDNTGTRRETQEHGDWCDSRLVTPGGLPGVPVAPPTMSPSGGSRSSLVETCTTRSTDSAFCLIGSPDVPQISGRSRGGRVRPSPQTRPGRERLATNEETGERDEVVPVARSVGWRSEVRGVMGASTEPVLAPSVSTLSAQRAVTECQTASNVPSLSKHRAAAPDTASKPASVSRHKALEPGVASKVASLSGHRSGGRLKQDTRDVQHGLHSHASRESAGRVDRPQSGHQRGHRRITRKDSKPEAGIVSSVLSLFQPQAQKTQEHSPKTTIQSRGVSEYAERSAQSSVVGVRELREEKPHTPVTYVADRSRPHTDETSTPVNPQVELHAKKTDLNISDDIKIITGKFCGQTPGVWSEETEMRPCVRDIVRTVEKREVTGILKRSKSEGSSVGVGDGHRKVQSVTSDQPVGGSGSPVWKGAQVTKLPQQTGEECCSELWEEQRHGVRSGELCQRPLSSTGGRTDVNYEQQYRQQQQQVTNNTLSRERASADVSTDRCVTSMTPPPPQKTTVSKSRSCFVLGRKPDTFGEPPCAQGSASARDSLGVNTEQVELARARFQLTNKSPSCHNLDDCRDGGGFRRENEDAQYGIHPCLKPLHLSTPALGECRVPEDSSVDAGSLYRHQSEGDLCRLERWPPVGLCQSSGSGSGVLNSSNETVVIKYSNPDLSADPQSRLSSSAREMPGVWETGGHEDRSVRPLWSSQPLCPGGQVTAATGHRLDSGVAPPTPTRRMTNTTCRDLLELKRQYLRQTADVDHAYGTDTRQQEGGWAPDDTWRQPDSQTDTRAADWRHTFVTKKRPLSLQQAMDDLDLDAAEVTSSGPPLYREPPQYEAADLSPDETEVKTCYGHPHLTTGQDEVMTSHMNHPDMYVTEFARKKHKFYYGPNADLLMPPRVRHRCEAPQPRVKPRRSHSTKTPRTQRRPLVNGSRTKTG